MRKNLPQKYCLIETTLPEPLLVKRYRYDHIRACFTYKPVEMFSGKQRKWPAEHGLATVFELMNQLPDGTIKKQSSPC